MTAYQDFTQDFPKRCLEVLDRTKGHSFFSDRDVTVLLMTAASAFVTPYERLKPDTDHSQHPSKENTSAMGTRLKDLLNEKFVDSSCFRKNGSSSWKIAPTVTNVTGDVESWLIPGSLSPLKNETVQKVLGHVRIALAHGIVYTRGKQDIKELVFVKSKDQRARSKGCAALTVSPADFEHLLRQWVQFLQFDEA